MIEISDTQAKWIFRQNQFQPRCIDYKRNVPNARWKRYPKTYPSTMAAIEALMALSRGETKEESNNANSG